MQLQPGTDASGMWWPHLRRLEERAGVLRAGTQDHQAWSRFSGLVVSAPATLNITHSGVHISSPHPCQTASSELWSVTPRWHLGV